MQHCFGSDDEVGADDDCSFRSTDNDVISAQLRKSKKKVEIIMNRYRLNKRLGSGSFGVVHLVQDVRNGDQLKVMKRISVGEMRPDETVDAVKEAKLQSKLHHENIVKFYDCFIKEDNVCIITEYCEGGDLFDCISDYRRTERQFDDSLISTWLLQLLLATQYLHNRRIIHRDLKTRNIFLKSGMLKIGDFGISKILAGTADVATTFTGTPYYMSPEVLKHEGYCVKSDIWSLGVILYELCTLKRPFDGKNIVSVMMQIANGEIPILPSTRNSSLVGIYLSMLYRDVSRRSTASELLQTPIMQSQLLVSDSTECHGQIGEQQPQHNFSTRSSTPIQNEADMSVTDQRPMTPRERLVLRKQERGNQDAERLRKLTMQSYAESRRQFSSTRAKQNKSVLGFSSESGISMTEYDRTRSTVSDDSVELKLTDETMADTYYSQFDFEMDSSDDDGSCLSSDDDQDALRDCMMDALNSEQESAEYSQSSPFTQTLHKRKIQSLRKECEQLLGDQFQNVYDYLKMARFECDGTVDEQVIMAKLKAMVERPRDCFLVDQLIFLEKQDEIILQSKQ